jgi:hypothetical protein
MAIWKMNLGEGQVSRLPTRRLESGCHYGPAKGGYRLNEANSKVVGLGETLTVSLAVLVIHFYVGIYERQLKIRDYC